MSWSAYASAILIQWRTQLEACATLAGITQAQYHTPELDIAADTFPAVLLQEISLRRDRYAEGAVPLVGFTLTADFYLPSSVAADDCAAEAFARAVINDLGQQYSGFMIKSMTTELCGTLTPGQRAVGLEDVQMNFRVARIQAEIGLTR